MQVGVNHAHARVALRGTATCHRPATRQHVATPGSQQATLVRRRLFASRANVWSQAAQQEAERLEKESSDRRRRRALEQKRRAEEEARPRTPEAVPGRAHADAQTDDYLEELSDRPVEVEVGVQTDPFADRPPTPPYVPPPSGVDAETQVEPGELFDFDREVEPLLEVLVGKTLEQGLMEVLEEEELAAIRAHQREFEALRAAELVRVQRLEEAQRRRDEERARRLSQERARAARERAVREKVAAAAFARQYVQGVRASVLGQLVDEGFFFDPVAKEVETTVLPGILEGASAGVRRLESARRLADSLIAAALQRGKALRAAEVARLQAERAEAEAAAEAARIAAEEEEAARLAAEQEAARVAAEAAGAEDEDAEDVEDEG